MWFWNLWDSFMKKIIVLLSLIFAQFAFSQKADKFVINDYLVTFPKVVEVKNLNKVSGQYHFVDNKKSNIQVSIRNASIMEFYNPNFDKTQLLEAYYKWDFDYWKENSIGAEIKEISKKIDENYILWEIVHKEFSTVFLFGFIDEKIVSISINNEKISQSDKIKYLVNLYKTISKFEK